MPYCNHPHSFLITGVITAHNLGDFWNGRIAIFRCGLEWFRSSGTYELLVKIGEVSCATYVYLDRFWPP